MVFLLQIMLAVKAPCLVVECIPTFSVEQRLVVGILAGVENAMFVSQEDIEDNREMGAEELAKYILENLIV